MKLLKFVLGFMEAFFTLVGLITVILAVRVSLEDCSEYTVTHQLMPFHLEKKAEASCEND